MNNRGYIKFYILYIAEKKNTYKDLRVSGNSGIISLSFFHIATAPIGSGPPHYRGLKMTLN